MKLVIIGAGRSGTNMLRDLLVSFEELGTWPCDEINYIWKHGNTNVPHDQLDSSHANTKVKQYINEKFDNMQKKLGSNIIVEKTCANSLRVDFVEEVLNKPYYIHIYRDPVDTVASAMKRWTAELDLPYVLKKVKYVPISDLPLYSVKYIKNRLSKINNKDGRLSTWGPVFENMEDMIQQGLSLHEICAYQWKECVYNSYRSFKNIPPNRVIHIEYNQFIEDPELYMRIILDKLKVRYDEAKLEDTLRYVKKTSIGKGYSQLNENEVDEVRQITNEVFKEVKNNHV